MLTKEEFEKLPKQEQEMLMKKLDEVQKATALAAAAEPVLPQLSMKDFEAKIKEVAESYIKGMTAVDRKHFAFPGIGTDKDLLDDTSAEGKYKKTVSFLKALSKGEVNTLNKLHTEANVKANLSSGSATAGGFLVPEEFTSEVLRLAPQYGVLRRECRIFPMSTDIKMIPKAGATDLTAHWVGEGGQLHSTDPNFGQALLQVRKLGSIPKVTNELLEDADVEVVTYLAELIAEAFAKEEDTQGFTGTGSPFIGLLQATGAPTSPHAEGTGFICLSYQDLVYATGDLYDNAVAGAKFYFHRTMLAHIRGLITTAGAPIFGAVAKEVAGYPLVSVEVLPGKNHSSAHTDATNYAIFGNLKKSIAIGDRKAITMKLSTEATVGSDNLFEQDMVALRAIERIAIATLIPSAYIKIQS